MSGFRDYHMVTRKPQTEIKAYIFIRFFELTKFWFDPEGPSGGPCGPPEHPQGIEGDAKDIFVITEAYVTTSISNIF